MKFLHMKFSPEEKQFEKLIENLPDFQLSRSARMRFYVKLFKRHIAQLDWRYFQKAFAVSLATLVLVAGSGTAYALQSHVTYGDFLYPLKRAEEKIELAFSRTPQQKIRTRVKFANRRLAELQKVEKKDFAVVPTADDMVKETELAMEEIKNLKDRHETQKTLAVIAQVQERQGKILAGFNGKLHFKDALAAVHTNLSEVVLAQSELDEAVEEGNENVQVVLQTTRQKPPYALEKFEEFQNQALRDVEETKQILENVKKNLAEQNTVDTRAIKFVERVERKIGNAQEALNEGDFGKARGLSQAGIRMLIKNNAEASIEASSEASAPPKTILPAIEPSQKIEFQPVETLIIPSQFLPADFENLKIQQTLQGNFRKEEKRKEKSPRFFPLDGKRKKF